MPDPTMANQDFNSALHSMIPTEQVNPRTTDIDLLSTEQVLRKINAEDQLVALAVEKAIPQITVVVDAIRQAFESGGRLFYFGAGTSGRLGVLDASECPPTYGAAPDLVQGIIAGGDVALRNAVEGAEDSCEQGQADVEKAGLKAGDVAVGISASGQAPYVVAAMRAAEALGCFTAGLTCDPASKLAEAVRQPIVVEVGPEAVAGSTRMKAGTAQKLVLNMLTTGAMIQTGKTFQNLMVDVQPTNLKLKARARRIVAALGQVNTDEASALLEQTAYQVKPAVLMARGKIELPEALNRLRAASGKLRLALNQPG
ncbi:N-acetylmuramic acid 6-phosphate etherase [Vampirovibrio sp.]|uniref:N-acetylmuramic acid 6-phosphate etherase n=1 Tax=Vampirovibrio sp. TaxID=2717857 RepID=UPI0035942F22